MGYKEKCGFREKVKVCSFKEEDCTPDTCDMYLVEFNAKSIKEVLKAESRLLEGLQKDVKKLKKTDPEAYKATKKAIKDKFYGLIYLSKAYQYLKRTGQ